MHSLTRAFPARTHKDEGSVQNSSILDRCTWVLNSFLASSHYCGLLIIFSNSLDPDQDRQNVGPDLDPNCLTLIAFLKEFFEKVRFEKKSTDDNKSLKKLPSMQR